MASQTVYFVDWSHFKIFTIIRCHICSLPLVHTINYKSEEALLLSRLIYMELHVVSVIYTDFGHKKKKISNLAPLMAMSNLANGSETQVAQNYAKFWLTESL